MNIEQLYGVRYYSPEINALEESDDRDLYTFTLCHGQWNVSVEKGDCAYYIDGPDAKCIRGPVQFKSENFAVIVRGFAPANKSASIDSRMILPYVNGCSTRQIFPPERPGDPTLQLLRIPPFSSEQAHHIHSTVRVVHVISGRGYSVVGMNEHIVRQELVPGMSVVLDNMSPHHFETDDSHLLVMPVHIWSATPLEHNHPMFNGTFLMNQGA